MLHVDISHCCLAHEYSSIILTKLCALLELHVLTQAIRLSLIHKPLLNHTASNKNLDECLGTRLAHSYVLLLSWLFDLTQCLLYCVYVGTECMYNAIIVDH